jgi:hypothetical protein
MECSKKERGLLDDSMGSILHICEKEASPY